MRRIERHGAWSMERGRGRARERESEGATKRLVPGCAVQQLFRGIGSKVKAEIKVKICGITSFKRSV